jgi:RimJ/RimL family protein N-acetyltransferase
MIRSALLARVSEAKQAKHVFDLTDGWGAKRLELAMLGAQGLINLSSAKAVDEALLLRWANDLQVRNNSFSPEPILPSSHAIWFKKALFDPNRLLFIVKTVDGCPIGQIRFDRPPHVDKLQACVANVDVSLDLCARGQGLASELLRLGLQAMEQCWGQTTDVVAEVLKTNVASNACFSRTGFHLEANSANHQTSVVNRWWFRRW